MFLLFPSQLNHNTVCLEANQDRPFECGGGAVVFSAGGFISSVLSNHNKPNTNSCRGVFTAVAVKFLEKLRYVSVIVGESQKSVNKGLQ